MPGTMPDIPKIYASSGALDENWAQGKCVNYLRNHFFGSIPAHTQQISLYTSTLGAGGGVELKSKCLVSGSGNLCCSLRGRKRRQPNSFHSQLFIRF